MMIRYLIEYLFWKTKTVMKDDLFVDVLHLATWLIYSVLSDTEWMRIWIISNSGKSFMS